MPKETTNEEILQAVNEFAGHTEEKFNAIDSKFNNIDTNFDKVANRFDRIENEISEIKSTMVTKDYLDDKLADLRGDLVVLMRKEDTKVRALIDILKVRKVISEEDVKKILALEPFSQNL
ncbi:MAG: hypothetical protein A2Y67_01895 [Candidatus Buchananbacteria bacterium RBG_13_39_9]|uniref:t-SNARE coiled-coil homology domain-containing protein n=1 Tax=Candidatus Buchananbacteria bacterium RBG_13_39_9 TaxID=1797531 RepID=A0A1G1XQD1_9BACT|nr:MAG: hypothetical protein A2Y67_01895 [Candidatus Buchananbacteria bacterium RBG_13_39_9]